MTKYKIVGLLNLFIGFPVLLLSLGFSIFAIPQMTSLYREMVASVSGNILVSLNCVAILLILGSGNIIFGILGFAKNQKTTTFFTSALSRFSSR